MAPRLAALMLAGLLLVGCSAPPASSAGTAPAPAAPAALPDRQEVIRYAATSGEGTWQLAQNPTASTSSREMFAYALALAEARMHPERLQALFETAAKMQDRDPASRGYGNFRWNWGQPGVDDYNAVEFCMQGGALLWLRHRDAMPEAARKVLRETLDFAVEGCLRHKVRPGYTNIALMNAGNLILLGEALANPKAADEGYARLDRIVMNTYEVGICEYGSPTYYGVDLDDLVLLEAFCRRESGRRQARALLELFWTDIALNYFPPSGRLAGPHSRDYDYLRGHGNLETHLWLAGWIAGPMRGGVGAVYPALGRWQPPARLLEMSKSRFPRLVRQVWGAEKTQSRTHYLLPDVTLGSAAANYHNMDLPLTVDLPGAADFPRCYFIPDARHDPYGKEKIKEGKGPHSKTLHLRPFWTAAQAYGDALGVVLYRDEEQTKTAKTLESHFVMPRDVDRFWIGDEPVALRPGAAASFPVEIGQALTFTQGGTVVGVRVLWAAGVGGKPATVALVDDGNKHGVVRLTVTHYDAAEPPPTVVGAGAALWVHINMINHLEDLAACRRAFAETKAQAQVASGRLTAKVATGDEPLSVEVGYPDGRDPVLNPAPSRAVLEIEGDDLGRKLLAEVEPVKSNLGKPLQAPTASMQPGTPLYLEAESGYVAFPMVTAEDAAASGGKFVWMPGEPGGQGGGQGGIAWALAVPAAGDYYVWGRVISPTPEDDSFFLDVSTEAAGPQAHLAWHLGTHPQWTWVPYAAEGRKEPTAVALPKGTVRFQVLAREDGARIDRLSITDKAGDKPQ